MASLGEEVAGLLAGAPRPDEASRAAVARRARDVLRPRGALARLDEVAAWLGGWQRRAGVAVAAPGAVIFVADHGVARRGVSAYPGEVTETMLGALRGGAATASVLARSLGARLEVVDVGVGRPTGDLSVGPALTEARFRDRFETGRRAAGALAAGEVDLLAVGEMGIANTTAAAAVASALFGLDARDWTGRGTGIDDDALARKVRTVEAARRRIAGVDDPCEVLRQVGGAETAAIAGAVLEARLRSLPVVLDGFVVTAAAAALEALHPGALDHCIAGHRSREPGHRLLLDKLGMRPLLDLDLALGEGSGALLALPLIRLAAACVTEVATFDEWGLGRGPGA